MYIYATGTIPCSISSVSRIVRPAELKTEKIGCAARASAFESPLSSLAGWSPSLKSSSKSYELKQDAPLISRPGADEPSENCGPSANWATPWNLAGFGCFPAGLIPMASCSEWRIPPAHAGTSTIRNSQTATACACACPSKQDRYRRFTTQLGGSQLALTSASSLSSSSHASDSERETGNGQFRKVLSADMA